MSTYHGTPSTRSSIDVARPHAAESTSAGSTVGLARDAVGQILQRAERRELRNPRVAELAHVRQRVAGKRREQLFVGRRPGHLLHAHVARRDALARTPAMSAWMRSPSPPIAQKSIVGASIAARSRRAATARDGQRRARRMLPRRAVDDKPRPRSRRVIGGRSLAMALIECDVIARGFDANRLPHDSRTTSSDSSVSFVAGRFGLSSRWHSRSTAAAPMVDIGTRTVVSRGRVIVAIRVSSKPTTGKSSGTARPVPSAASMMPAAISSLAANTAARRRAHSRTCLTPSSYAVSYS